MTAAAFGEKWWPSDTELVIERIDATALEARAASVGIIAYADNLLAGRRREYLAGRLAARAALQSLVAPDPGVGCKDGAPVWPSGYCGSISHSAGLAVAVAASCRQWRALGIDIEVRLAANRIRVVRQAMSADEFDAAQASSDPWRWTRAWTAKEAAYKCLSALGAEVAFDLLVPRWTSTDHAELHAWVNGAEIRIVLDCCIHDELMWMVASA